MNNTSIIDELKIKNILGKPQHEDSIHVHDLLQKALELKGLNSEEVAFLAAVTNPDLLAEIFSAAQKVKEEIYGKRLVIFAPLYISNICSNECLYCGFRVGNKELERRALTQDEITAEVKFLIDQGQKRLLLVAGENNAPDQLQYIYATKSKYGEIRRVNVNLAPLSLEDFRKLKLAEIGTYQLFQETYHHETYHNVHVSGKKTDYNWRLTAVDRAIETGIDDIGIGILFGLADWRFEILALLQHITHLNDKFGIGPHTLSVPRLEPAHGSLLASAPTNPVSDFDFCKIIAILRLAIPYTGIILSTRESVALRSEAFALGVSQISAGSRTNPGGYGEKDNKNFSASQFCLGDERSLDEVVRDIVELGYLPSFCTACYRSGRTGDDFMTLAKSGAIKNMCNPNALLTFKEYLLNYASEQTRTIGEKLITKEFECLPVHIKPTIMNLINQMNNGNMDVFI